MDINEAPAVLYKYRIWDEYGKRVITENQVYLAAPDQFNDPFDVGLPYKHDKAELTDENMWKKFYEMEADNTDRGLHEQRKAILAKRIADGIFKDDRYWKEHYGGFKQRLQQIGILSLTTQMDNLLMWSHYSSSHQGFCVGFDSKILYDACQGLIHKVKCQDEFPILPLFGNNEQKIVTLITTKSKQWEYEDEYRIHKLGGAKQVVKLPNEAYREIILGVNMLPNVREEILSLATSKYPYIKVFQASLNEEAFRLDFKQIN